MWPSGGKGEVNEWVRLYERLQFAHVIFDIHGTVNTKSDPLL